MHFNSLTALGAVAATMLLSSTPVAAIGPTAFLAVACNLAGNYVYFHGGTLNLNTTAQSNELMALDISKSWPLSTPLWSNLTVAGSPAAANHALAPTADGLSLLVTSPQVLPYTRLYNIAAKTWSTVATPASVTDGWANRTNANLVADATGNLWLMGGDAPAPQSQTNEVDMYASSAWSANVLPATAKYTLGSFTLGTSNFFRNKIYNFGGIVSSSGARGYATFQQLPWVDVSTSPPTANTQFTLGPTPPARQDHCAVTTKAGRTYVLGGYDVNSKTTFSDMWVLDMVTMTWTQVVPTNPAPRRYGVACTVVGANIIIYGGRNSDLGNVTGTGFVDVQVFDITTSTWLNQYAPKQDTTVMTPDPTSGSSSGLGTGALIGIIAGAVALVALIVGVVIFRKRQKKIEIKEAQMEKEAYLASLRPEQPSHTSPSAAHLTNNMSAMNSPMMLNSGGAGGNGGSYTGMESLIQSPAGSNVQYLVQHLPDGSIAMQPVFVDPSGGMTSPSSTSNLYDPNDQHSYMTPLQNHQQGFFSPPPPMPVHGGGSSSNFSPQLNKGNYVLPPGHSNNNTQEIYQQQQPQDPFASPQQGHQPLSPQFGDASHR